MQITGDAYPRKASPVGPGKNTLVFYEFQEKLFSQLCYIMSYHLRITTPREAALAIIDKYLDAFHPVLFCFSYEEVGDNKHIHAHLEYSEHHGVPKKQTLCDWFKKNDLKGKYYHKEVEKDNNSNIQYVIKDLDILKHNIAELAMDELMNKTKKINADKKKNARHKLLELVEARHREWLALEPKKNEDDLPVYEGPIKEWLEAAPFQKLSDIAYYIMRVYIDDYDKEPPLAHMRGYVLYIALKLQVLLNCQHIDIELNHYWDSKI